MTHRLLFKVEGAVETNPIADFFIDKFDFNGAIGFKLLVVTVVCIIAQIVAIKKVKTAKFGLCHYPVKVKILGNVQYELTFSRLRKFFLIT